MYSIFVVCYYNTLKIKCQLEETALKRYIFHIQNSFLKAHILKYV